MILLLDAANTIIYKPSVFNSIQKVLCNYGYNVDIHFIERKHKFVSEIVAFPDTTSNEFYKQFNTDLLYSLGISPSPEILSDIFNACSYAPWVSFDDTNAIGEFPGKVYVLSNFHKELESVLTPLFKSVFSGIITSEEVQLRKPSVEFYEYALQKMNTTASEVVYIGDSIKLDLDPALKLGMNAWLIDRNNFYPYCKRRISSLREIKNLLN